MFLPHSVTANEEQFERSNDPLFEFGILGGLVQTPDYPGSDQSRVRGIAFPNFRYRGKIFRSEENEGTRARVVRDPVYKLDFSFGFNFPVNNGENNARFGMRNIESILEFGPRVKVRLIPESVGWTKLELVFPFRVVYEATLKKTVDRGFTFSPGIQVGKKGVFCERCMFFVRYSALFATERYFDVFYQVDTADVSPNRSFFDADQGFQGTNVFGGYVLRIGKVQSFLGVNYSSYSGATNLASPLMRTRDNTTLILGLGWLFLQSEERGYK